MSECFFYFDAAAAESYQLCPTLYDPIDCILPGSSVRGILQARILEWGARPSSRGSSQPRDQTHISYTYLHWQEGPLPLAPPGKPPHVGEPVLQTRHCAQSWEYNGE